MGLIRKLLLLGAMLGLTSPVFAEALTTLDLVRSDAAACLEIPRLTDQWTHVESGLLLSRLKALPAFHRLLDSRGFQQWQTIDNHVAAQTGQTLSAQLRNLLGNSLVLAVYVPVKGNPQGILIGEAVDAAGVERAQTTWNKLEPNEVISTKTYREVRYQQRRKRANANESVFVVTSDRWFALSDQETLIQDVIDRLLAFNAGAPTSSVKESLRQSPLYLQNRQRLPMNAAAYLFLNARPWDHGLEEASRDPHQPVNPAAIWKHITAVSASLQLDQGVVCNAVVELETSRLPSGWSQFVSAAAGDATWSRRIPSDALLAVSGHFDVSHLVHLFLSQIKPGDRDELAKNRRIARSLLSGNDLLETVLPALARDFCGSIVSRIDSRNNRVYLDGMLGFHFDSSSDAKLMSEIVRGLDGGLTVLAAHFSAEGTRVVTVQNEQSNSKTLRWLSEAAPIPVGYATKGQNLAVAATPAGLRQALDTFDNDRVTSSRLVDHANRFFPKANQLVWFDVARTRQLLEKNAPDIAQLVSHGSADEAGRITEKLEQVRPMLGLVDSLFVAGQIESDYVRIVFGGGLDVR